MGKTRYMTLPLAAVVIGLLLSGCIEHSTVIKVNRDGSGIIHERRYTVPADKLISFPGIDTKEEVKEKPKLPAEAALKEYAPMLKEYAPTLGEGVAFRSVKPSTNKKGWQGYEIIFDFEDINTVQYSPLRGEHAWA
jgi:hypothetical protein